jgi:cell division protein FtsQ
MADSGPASVRVRIDPRIRQRRIDVQRRAGRRRLRLLLIVTAALLLTVGIWLTLRSSLLDVDRVRVIGTEHTPVSAVVHASGVRRGDPMITVDGHAVARRVKGLPWVATAKVRRLWPGTLEVTVKERLAVAATRANASSWAVLDASARVLEWVPSPPPALFPLEGLEAVPPPGATLDTARGLLAVRAALTPELAARTASLAAAPGGQVDLRLNPRGTVEIGTPVDLAAKVSAVETVLASIDVRNLATLDVRLPSSPVVTRG